VNIGAFASGELLTHGRTKASFVDIPSTREGCPIGSDFQIYVFELQNTQI